MNLAGAGRYPGTAIHQHKGGFPHLISHSAQWLTGCPALVLLYTTLREFFNMSAVSPSSLIALEARWQLTDVYRNIIRRKSTMLARDGCVMEPGSPWASPTWAAVRTFRSLPPCFHPLMSSSWFTCRKGEALFNCTHRKVYPLTPRSTGTQRHQPKKEVGKCPAKLLLFCQIHLWFQWCDCSFPLSPENNWLCTNLCPPWRFPKGTKCYFGQN